MEDGEGVKERERVEVVEEEVVGVAAGEEVEVRVEEGEEEKEGEEVEDTEAPALALAWGEKVRVPVAAALEEEEGEGLHVPVPPCSVPVLPALRVAALLAAALALAGAALKEAPRVPSGVVVRESVPSPGVAVGCTDGGNCVGVLVLPPR